MNYYNRFGKGNDEEKISTSGLKVSRPSLFNPKVRQGDVSRAVKGAEAAGKTVTQVEVEAGRIVLTFAGVSPATTERAYDAWRGRRDASAA